MIDREEKFIRVPVESIADVPHQDGYYQCLTNRWWVVVDGCILIYKGFSPQCNETKDIADRMAVARGGAVEFIKRAFIKHHCDN